MRSRLPLPICSISRSVLSITHTPSQSQRLIPHHCPVDPRSWRLQPLLNRRFKSSSASNSSGRARVPSVDPPDDFYALLLSQPLLTEAKTSGPTILTSPPKSTASATSDLQKQRSPQSKIIFTSRLVDPGSDPSIARAAAHVEAQARGEGTWMSSSTNSGKRIWVPPKPEEPDNCCMSGCVNCVWDGYREDLEIWAFKRSEGRMLEREAARAEIEEGESGIVEDGPANGVPVSGGWEIGESPQGGLFEDVPVGIREFMRTEKRLGEKRRRLKEKEKESKKGEKMGSVDQLGNGDSGNEERLNALG